MRVLHVIPSVSPRRGGPSFVLRSMVRGLSGQGIQVDVATTDDDGEGRLSPRTFSRVEEDGGSFYFFPRQLRPYTVSARMAAWLWRNIPCYDLVHVHALFSWPSSVASHLAMLRSVPYIVRPLGVLNPWGMVNRRPLAKRVSVALVERRMLARAAAVHFTAVSEQQAAEALGCVMRPMVLGNPVELPSADAVDASALRRRNPQLRDKLVVTFLSRLDRTKGLDLLLPAFRKLTEKCRDVALVVAGSGDPEVLASAQSLAKRLQLTNVFWRGFTIGEQKWELLRGADLFVLPSYSENFGVSAVEAMGMGLATIVTDQVGICSDIEAANAGLVSHCSAESLFQAMDLLATDTDFRIRLAHQGMRLVQERYSPAAISARLVDLYRSILSSTYERRTSPARA